MIQDGAGLVKLDGSFVKVSYFLGGMDWQAYRAQSEQFLTRDPHVLFRSGGRSRDRRPSAILWTRPALPPWVAPSAGTNTSAVQACFPIACKHEVVSRALQHWMVTDYFNL